MSSNPTRRDFVAASVALPLLPLLPEQTQFLPDYADAKDLDNSVVVINVDRAVFDALQADTPVHFGYYGANRITDRHLDDTELVDASKFGGQKAYAPVGYWTTIAELGNNNVSVICISEKYSVEEIDAINDNTFARDSSRYSYPAIGRNSDGGLEVRERVAGEVLESNLGFEVALKRLLEQDERSNNFIYLGYNDHEGPYDVMEKMRIILEQTKPDLQPFPSA